MVWLFFKGWTAKRCEPYLLENLKKQQIHSCVDTAIILDVHDEHEILKLCNDGLKLKNEKFIAQHVKPSYDTSLIQEELQFMRRREILWHQHIQEQNAKIKELHVENDILKRKLFAVSHDTMHASMINEWMNKVSSSCTE